MEKKLIYIVSISGILLVIMMILHTVFMSNEFASPRVIIVTPVINGYSANADLIQGKEYGIVITATMHVDDSSKFRNNISLKIESESAKLKRTNYIVGNNSIISSGWIDRSKRIFYQKEYLRKFTSPITCNECTLLVQGHSPIFLKNYKLELHEDINEAYYWLGYILALSGLIFVSSGILSIIFIIKQSIKKIFMQLKLKDDITNHSS